MDSPPHGGDQATWRGRVSRRWPVAVGVAVVACWLLAVAAWQWSRSDSPQLTVAPHGGLWTNGERGEGSLTAGYSISDHGRVGAFGLVIVENQGDDPITLHGVLAEPSEGLSVTDSVVAPPDRVYTWTTLLDHFPPDREVWGDYEPLEGFVLLPSGEVDAAETDRPLRRGYAVMLGIEIDDNVNQATLDGYCIDYSVGDSSTLYRRCLTQAFEVSPQGLLGHDRQRMLPRRSGAGRGAGIGQDDDDEVDPGPPTTWY